VEKRKVLHCQESILGYPAYSPSLYWVSYPDSSVSISIMLKVTESAPQNGHRKSDITEHFSFLDSLTMLFELQKLYVKCQILLKDNHTRTVINMQEHGRWRWLIIWKYYPSIHLEILRTTTKTSVRKCVKLSKNLTEHLTTNSSVTQFMKPETSSHEDQHTQVAIQRSNKVQNHKRFKVPFADFICKLQNSRQNLKKILGLKLINCLAVL
jgi:hypothetical protein